MEILFTQGSSFYSTVVLSATIYGGNNALLHRKGT